MTTRTIPFSELSSGRDIAESLIKNGFNTKEAVETLLQNEVKV